jgi:hypothetical protein
MPIKVIPGKGWLKGVNASVAYTSQPKGTLARVSNLTYNSRGALRACDQNMGICTLGGVGPNPGNEGPFTAIQYFSPATNSRKILGLQKDVDTRIDNPSGLTAAVGGSGGTLPVGTYYYVVTAIDGAGGETLPTNEVAAVITSLGQTVTLNWGSVPLTVGYNVYRGVVSGLEGLLFGGGVPTSTNSYIDTGTAAVSGAFPITSIASNNFGDSATFLVPAYGGNLLNTFQVLGGTIPGFNVNWIIVSSLGNGVGFIATPVVGIVPANQTSTGATGDYSPPPLVNTTQTVSLLDLSGMSYSKPANVIQNFPADNVPSSPGFPGGGGRGGSGGGSGGGTSGGSTAPQPGTVLGNTSPTPDLVPFAGKMIVVLGSGVTPYQSDGTNVGTIPLVNTFTGAFPSWFTATSYAAGDIIQPSTPNGHVYICIQPGISGGSQPTFPTATGARVTDNNVIWQENGSNATVAPRGAAHAINHAGSLWLWNTSPSDTTDSLDGPSCLKMSDTNNPNSWNPINTAFVGRNDGQQGMGCAAFTIAEAGIPPTDTLVLFKEFSTYQVTGVFGASDFAIQQAQTDLGCIAPRTIKFVPGFGIVRLTHLGYAVFDGVRDRLISEEIRPYLFGGVTDISPMDWSYAYFAKGDQVAVPPMYVSAIPVLNMDDNGSLTRLLCYDLVLKAWTIIDLPFGIGTITQLRIPGGIPLTVFGGFNDGMMSRWQAGDQQGWQAWIDPTSVTHTGTPLVASFREGTIYGPDASDRLFFRRTILRGKWQGGAQGGSTITTSVNVDDQARPAGPARYIGTPTGGASDKSFEVVTDIGLTGLNSFVNVTITQAIGGAPVEIVGLDYHVVQRPVGGLARVG